MSKFTLFTLFLSATIVVIVAELLVNEYIKYPESRRQIAASVLDADVTQTAASGQTQDPSSAGASTLISFALIAQAGFSDVSLQRVPFNGILFESIDLRDFKSVPVVSNNLLENNRRRIASFNEFAAGSRLLAKEVYQYLKEKSGKLIGASINESNDFGDNSFFVNFIERSETAFLVVKKGDNVYSLTYLKEFHPLIKKLISLFS